MRPKYVEQLSQPYDLSGKEISSEMLQDRKDILKAQLVAFEAFFIWTEELREQGKQFFHTTISLQDSQLLPYAKAGQSHLGSFRSPPPRVWQKVFEIAAPGILHSGLQLHLWSFLLWL